MILTVEDTKAALRTFDEHLHLMTLIEPCCIQDGLQTAGLIPSNNSFTSSTSSSLMENVLKEVRNYIELNGAGKFLTFVNILQAEGRYVIFGCHIFSKHLRTLGCIYVMYQKFVFKHCSEYKNVLFTALSAVIAIYIITNYNHHLCTYVYVCTYLFSGKYQSYGGHGSITVEISPSLSGMYKL